MITTYAYGERRALLWRQNGGLVGIRIRQQIGGGLRVDGTLCTNHGDLHQSN